MNKKILYSFVLCLLIFSGAFGNPDSREIFHNNPGLKSEFLTLQKKFPQIVRVSDLVKTKSGNSMILVTIGKNSHDDKSGILLVGSADGSYLPGSEVALKIAVKLAEQYGKVDSVTTMLNKHVLYIIPRLNPDAAEYYFKKIKFEHPYNNTPIDNDHDGLIDEDGPEDLNHDNMITIMRVKDPEGKYMIDPENPLLLRKADPAKGEKGEYKIYTEGIDNDSDGLFNEDGTGGVDINKNFPQEYPAFKKNAGKFMESEPETRAVSKFLFDHRNIVLTLTYGLYDNLVNSPKPLPQRTMKPASEPSQRRFGFSRKPVTKLNTKDIPYYKAIGDLYKKITGLTGKSTVYVNKDKGQGSFYKWVYFQRGILSLTTSLITIPEKPVKNNSKNDPQGKNPSKKMKNRSKGENDPSAMDKKWLEYFKANNIPGYVEWKPYNHKQLGRVEIGGFAPFAKTTFLQKSIEQLSDQQTKFICSLFDKLPQIVVEDINVKPKGSNIFAVSAYIKNIGYLPTATAHGEKTRLAKPVLVKFYLKKGELISGNKITFIPALKGSGSAKKVEWLVHAPAGTKITLKVISETAGRINRTVTLK
ncbi:hypothetical protein DRQ07_07425 [candidate division KSB1 bacterium]|nr:MAG: hypothetical protein DRQ07_07425 [candidate division KSB1 bacterium]